MLIDLLQQCFSAFILYWFLTILFMLSLWHNYITVHFKRKPDPRDVRASQTTIHQHNGRDDYTVYPSNSQQHGRRVSRTSISSRTPLDIESDEENNIEYDHTISAIMTEDAQERLDQDEETTENTNANGHHIGDNPFDEPLATEDMKLVPNLRYYYRQYDINIEEYEVETDDGFILDLWHLVPMNMTQQENKRIREEAYPMLMLHGLLQSSGSFASSGRKSLAYFMFESGFDVWLGNNRCGFNPKWNMHKLKERYGQNANLEFKKWDWDVNEMTTYDLKTHIEFILRKKPNFEKLTLMSHSQGTTQAFMGLVNGTELYNNKDNDTGFSLVDKLDNYIALAPAIYPGPLLDEKMFVKFMGSGIDHPWVFGKRSFMPLMMQMRNLAAGLKPFSFFSYIMFNYLFDWNDVLWDRCLRDRHFLFSPVHISVKLMQWWLSPDPSKISFKHGADKIFPPERTWFPINNAEEDKNENTGKDTELGSSSALHLNKARKDAGSFPRLLLFIPRQDRLVNGEKLINHFINHEDKSIYKIWYIDEYSHLDVLWAHDVIDRIGQPVLDSIRLPDNITAGINKDTSA